jgi:cytochrome c oxidase assembly protein subunit 15
MARMNASEKFWESRTAVGYWLLAVAGVILSMIVIGGLTRLTGSGLSITEWKPIMGALPPMSDAAWADAFHKYRQIPQYLIENKGMTLDQFKGIFWWEWGHRFLGRFLGLIFLVPFLWFASVGAIKRVEWPGMLLLFALGGLQGLIGWWMVSSGLEVRTSVSQYRLAIHLGAALVLLATILWIALYYLRPQTSTPARVGAQTKQAWDARRGYAFIGLVYVQMLLGALVAGLDAGLIYNTWPDMNGAVLPDGPLNLSPWWINFFENHGLVQFNHRIGGYIVAGAAAFMYARGIKLTGAAKTSAKAIAILTTFQIFLGISTLLLVSPLWLSALHQLVAAALLSAAVWHAFELKRLR